MNDPKLKYAIAAVGDVADINCWSGIPYHFWQAAVSRGWKAVPWRLRMDGFVWSRRIWNVRQWMAGRGVGGYQYSDAFARRAERMIPSDELSRHIISFNQHFPQSETVRRYGGRLSLYLDATFPLLLERYGLAKTLPREIQRIALEQERETFVSAERLVFFSRWAAESAIRDCGADPGKVRVICPGANLAVANDWEPSPRPVKWDSRRPFVLGFVGKDWRRKGLPFLLQIRERLEAMGTPALVRCVGNAPSALASQKGVEFLGFIDKRREMGRFIEFLSSCDLGCFFSSAEASSIAALEFLRAGVPTAGFTVDGMTDLLPADAALRFNPTAKVDEVASAIHQLAEDEGRYVAIRESARRWSALVTWDRCIGEWTELLEKGAVAKPVRPWLGLEQQGR